MPFIACTRRLEQVGPHELTRYSGDTVGSLLDATAADYPRLKTYVLDDQGRVRKHVAIFVDGNLQPRDAVLQLPLNNQSEIYIMQALSGG